MSRNGPKNPKGNPSAVRTRIWLVMRMLRQFSLPQVAAAAEASLATVERYVRQLRTIEYVKLDRRAGQGVDWTEYRLVKDTGPDHPQLVRDGGGAMYDGNLDSYVLPKAMKARIDNQVRNVRELGGPSHGLD